MSNTKKKSAAPQPKAKRGAASARPAAAKSSATRSNATRSGATRSGVTKRDPTQSQAKRESPKPQKTKAVEVAANPRKSKYFRSGTVAILGRPNAGKSTLLNALMEVAVSATSSRPQTTRTNVRGIVQVVEGARDKKMWTGQIVFIDTPGVNLKKGQLLDRVMIGSVEDALNDVDVALWVGDARTWGKDLRDLELEKPGTDKALGWLRTQIAKSARAREKGEKATRWIVVLSKIDTLGKPELLPLIERTVKVIPEVSDIVPVAGLLGLVDDSSNLQGLLNVVKEALPSGEPLYDIDAWTDLSERNLVQQLVREAIFQFGREEVPYECDCEIIRFQEPEGSRKMPEVDATIWVGKNSIKPIVVGKGGSRIREINHQVRTRFREVTGEDLVLRIMVKVNEKWFTRARDLRELGYGLPE